MTNKKWLAIAGVAVVVIALGTAIALNQGNFFSGNLNQLQTMKVTQQSLPTYHATLSTAPNITCTTDPSPAYVNTDITWSAKLNNVISPVGLNFVWSGNGIPSPAQGNSVTVNYPSIDVNGIVSVTGSYWNANENIITTPRHTVTATCTVPLTVKPAPAAALSSICTPSSTTAIVGDQVTYTGTVMGGQGPYTYSWSGTDIVSADAQTMDVTYAAADIGAQKGTFKVTDAANQTSSSDCNVTVKTDTPTLTAACSSSSTALTGKPTTLTGSASGGTAPYIYSWSGTEVGNATSALVSATYTDAEAGPQTATFTVKDSLNNSASAQCSLNVAHYMAPQKMTPTPSTQVTTTTPSTTTPTTTTTANNGCTGFTDINSNDVDCAAIGYVRGIGAITGNPDGSFNPGGLIQRDQVAKIALETFKLYDENGAYCSGGSTGFPDVTLKDWSYQYVCRAKSLGVITGYLSGADNGYFRPSRFLSRAEFLAIILRNLSGQLQNGSSYSDVSLSDWFSPYASFAYTNGLYSSNMLYPAESVTRREATEVLYKLHQLGKI